MRPLGCSARVAALGASMLSRPVGIKKSLNIGPPCACVEHVGETSDPLRCDPDPQGGAGEGGLRASAGGADPQGPGRITVTAGTVGPRAPSAILSQVAACSPRFSRAPCVNVAVPSGGEPRRGEGGFPTSLGWAASRIGSASVYGFSGSSRMETDVRGAALPVGGAC